MQSPPTSDEVRVLLTPLDELDRKVVGGLVALMMTKPGSVRDQEWIAEQFVNTAVIAHGFEGDAEASDEDVKTIQNYARARMPDLTLAAASLFVRIAEDLRQSGDAPTLEAAKIILQGYLAGSPPTSE
jgi:hypothetical protein